MTEKNIFKLISRFSNEVSPHKKISLDGTFKEMGFDELDMLEMIMDLEIELDINLIDIDENPNEKVSEFISKVMDKGK